jgi:hypothetical protein
MSAPIYPARVVLSSPGPNGGTPVGDATTPLVVTQAAVGASTPQSLKRISANFTRPTGTTQYTAGDAVNNSTSAATLLAFANAALAAGRGGVIQSAILHKSGTTVTSAQFRLHLWASDVGAPVNDNAAMPYLYANRASYVGYIDFATMVTGTGSNTEARVMATNIALPYDCAATTLYGMLEALAGYTPADSETFDVELFVLRD